MDRGIDCLLLPYTYTLVVVLWASCYTCNIIGDVNPWFSKCGWTVNLFCDNHVIITYWLKKRIRKFMFLKYSFFWKRTVILSFSRNYLQMPSSYDILMGNWIYIVKLNFLVEDLTRWKRGFEIFFDWPLHWWYWE